MTTTQMQRMISKAMYEFGMARVNVKDVLMIELRDAMLRLYGRHVP